MNEYNDQFNGVDFTKMTEIERSDWSIPFTNTLFKQGSNNLETGVGQYGRSSTVVPSGTLDPLKI